MQVAIPIEVSPAEIARERSLGAAITLCAKAAGYEGKAVQQELKFDKAQWSRWESGQEGVCWPKLVQVMDFCGNDSPVLWMYHARGYDLHSVRRIESSVERENRTLREENAALRRVLITGAVHA